jgi:serine protease Do
MPFEDLQEFFEGMPDKLRKVKSAASGFFINAQGTILTNYHVVADAIPDGEIIVKLHDDTELPAKVVGFDKRVDIALLKVDVAKPVPFAVFGDAKKVRTGDRVITVGNPFGLGSTVTSGIVSYKSRDISSRSGIKVTEYVDDLIQTDASVNQGNSGGPLFNMKGEVIGINTAIYSPTGAHVGLAFAIPSNTVTPYIEQIQKFGKPRHGWIGVHIQPLTDEISENLGLPKGKGALVASIVPEGPAGKAGLKTGDVIVKFNDIDVKDSRRLPRMVGETVPGKAVPIVLWRDKKEVTCSVKVEDFEAAEEAGLLPGSSDTRHPEKGKMVFDMELHTLTREYRDRFDIRSNQKGVIITDIKRESQPWAKFIRPGDVIVAVDQTEVETPQDVSRLVDQARKKEKKSVLFLISRGDDLIFIALKLESKDQEKKEKTLKEGE